MLSLAKVSARLQPGSIDTSFDAGDINGNPPWDGSEVIEDIVVAPDGKIYIVGHFDTVQGVHRANIALLHADGSLDLTFENRALYSDTHALFLQSDGNMLAGHSRSYRLDSAGRFDQDFRRDRKIVTSLADGRLLGFELENDSCDTCANLLNHRLRRFEPDGRIDFSFMNDVRLSGDLSRRPITIQPDGKLLFLHEVSAEGEGTRIHLSRFTPAGAFDWSFNGVTISNSHAPWAAAGIGLQPDGKILLFGQFDHINEQKRGALVRLQSDGNVDEQFHPPKYLLDGATNGAWLVSGQISILRAVEVQRDGKILVGGGFPLSTNGGQLLVRLQPDGSPDATFRLDEEMNSARASRIVLQPDGRILAAGTFESGGKRRSLVRLHAVEPLELATPQPQPDGVMTIPVLGVGAPASVTVQVTTSLAFPDWKAIPVTGTATTSMFALDVGATNAWQRYYRAIILISR